MKTTFDENFMADLQREQEAMTPEVENMFRTRDEQLSITLSGDHDDYSEGNN